MHNLHIRLGRFEFYAQRQTTPAFFKVTRGGPGEITVDLPWITIFLTNIRVFEAHRKALMEVGSAH